MAMDREITQIEKSRKKRKIIVRSSLVVMSCIGGIVLIISYLRPGIPLKNIRTSVVELGSLDFSISATGVIMPAYQEFINSPISSKIIEVMAQVGDTVEVGTPLLKLDLQSANTDLGKMEDEYAMKLLKLDKLKTDNKCKISDSEMRLKVFRMELNQKYVEWKNECYLDSLGAGTTEKVRQYELAYKRALLQLEQDELKFANEKTTADIELKIQELDLKNYFKTLSDARRTLNEAQIRSPRHAILLDITTDIGAQISVGEKLATISDLSNFKISGEVADAYSNKIVIGTKTMIQVGDQKIDGYISEVVPSSQNGVITFSVRLLNPNNEMLRSGLKADIYILTDKKSNVPKIAMGQYYRNKGSHDLFVVQGNRLVKRKVVLGDNSADWVEVIEGLDIGEKVVVSDMNDYINNSELTIK